MPLGNGWWYDRRSHRYHKITEHATDAVEFPRRFRSQAVAHLSPINDREVIVRHVAAQGFIRLRLWKANFGFEFHGDPETAVAVLRRFIKREELGPVIEVNISDFATGISVLTSVVTVLASTSAADLGFTEARR